MILVSPVGFVILALAVFRVWRLVAQDDILQPVRLWILSFGRDSSGGRLPGFGPALARGIVDFLTCPWCFGLWLSVIAYLLARLTWSWSYVPATMLAVSAIVGLLGSRS